MNKTIYRIMSIIMTIALTLGGFFNVGASVKSSPQLAAITYFVSAIGSDTNNCTQQVTPCKSFNKAMSLAQAGDVIRIVGVIPAINVTKSGIIIEGGTVDGIANKVANSSAIAISASNITIRNVEIINGWSYGIRTGAGKGDGLVLDNVAIHNNVLENKTGSTCSTTTSSGWGSAFRAYYSSNIVVKNSLIYDNCGEGFSSIMSNNVLGLNLEIYDNFSVNIYPDQTRNFSVTDSVISCIKPEYQRMGLSRSLLLGAERYSGITTNMLDGITFERNKIYNCKGVGAYAETSGSWKNVRIVNNEFYNVPAPVFVSIVGTNIVTSPNVIALIPTGATLTQTKTPAPATPSKTSTTMPTGQPTNTAMIVPSPTITPISLTATPTTSSTSPVTTNSPIPTLLPASATTAASQGQNTIEVRVLKGADDVEESETGWIYIDSTDLELAYDSNNQVVGIRFVNLNVPKGATITNAYLQFKVDETTTSAVSLSIQGEASSNASAFVGTARNISSRTRTTNTINWSPPSWSTLGAMGTGQQTPNLAPVVQEIVNQSGWAAGNSLVMIISGTGKRVAEAYEDDPAGAPLLHIEYTTIANLMIFPFITTTTVLTGSPTNTTTINSPAPTLLPPTSTIPATPTAGLSGTPSPSPIAPAPSTETVTPIQTPMVVVPTP
ncbi:MAG: right-handed parallel beta-helix repeat-containing protein [Anaerolineales bacterium]|nr:right-handed parallel beta-helix repeat-containing protein [Anaerolineales bacterium]